MKPISPKTPNMAPVLLWNAGALALALATAPVAAQEAPLFRERPPALRGVAPAPAMEAGPMGLTGAAPGVPRSARPPTALYSAGAVEPAPQAAINHARPRKAQQRPLLNPPPNPGVKAGRPALPPLEPYKSSYAARRQAREMRGELRGELRGSAFDPRIPVPAPPPGVAMEPTIPVKPRRIPEADPYAPLGVRLGGLRLVPYMLMEGGYDTNPNRVNRPARGSKLLHGEVGTSIESNWANHSVKGDLRFGYYDALDVKGADRPEGRGKIDARIDVTRDTQVDVGGAFSVDTLRPGSPEIQPGANRTSTNRPVAWSVGGYLGATHRFNRLELSLRGTLDRSQTGDAQFSDGTTQRLSLNNHTTIGVKPRISYELTPGVKPFVEATIDRRIHDSEYDVNNFRRNSRGLALRAGTSVEIARTLTGEISGGYAERAYEDPRLVNLRGPVIDAQLVWNASPLTTVKLRAGTSLNETTIPNASGALVRRVSGEISHALLRNVTITGTLGYQVSSYQGRNLSPASNFGSVGINERLLSVGVRADYNLTRTVVVRGSWQHERLKTTVPGADFTTNVFLLGLRLQR